MGLNFDMFAQSIRLINAHDYEGELEGLEIMVDAVHHREWFEKAAEGSGLLLNEIFRVHSVDRFGCTRYLNFVSDRREHGQPVYYSRPFDGCGEDYRFNVVEP